MKRRLRDKLVLLVKQKGSMLNTGDGGASTSSSSGGGESWAFPHARHAAGETVRQTAERALREAVGVVDAFFIGNAPMAHYRLAGGGGGGGSGASSSSSGDGAEANAASDGASSSGGASSSFSSSGSKSSSSSGGGSNGSSGGAVFFMLAQVVNDPWDASVARGFASDHAWVAPDELPRYIGDARLLELARKML